jgi:hypothetical protein
MSSMGLFEFAVRGGVARRRGVVASGQGRASRRKADFTASRNALGSIKDDDEHEKRESAVVQSSRRGKVRPADRKAHLRLAQRFGQSRYGDRVDNRAGQAARPADHQHRDDEEGQVEIVVSTRTVPRKCATNTPETPLKKALSVKAIQRWRTISTPAALAATSSSREARSSKPPRDS